MAEITGTPVTAPTVTILINVSCEVCGKDLDDTLVIVGSRIKVPPCKECARLSHHLNYNAGYEKGRDDGYNQAIEESES